MHTRSDHGSRSDKSSPLFKFSTVCGTTLQEYHSIDCNDMQPHDRYLHCICSLHSDARDIWIMNEHLRSFTNANIKYYTQFEYVDASNYRKFANASNKLIEDVR